MRVGLLARCDERGIAQQTHEFFLNMKPVATLVMLLQDPAWPEDPAKFEGRGIDHVYVDPKDRLLDERKVRKLLRNVDVLFAVETLMDWRLVEWAHEERVRTIIQGNPEFYIHQRDKSLPHPDVWCWPTTWLQNQLPVGPTLPVPVPNQPPTMAADPNDGPLRVLHVAGHAAAADRNGTLPFMAALEYVKRDVEVTVIGQDGWLPEARPAPKVKLMVNPFGVDDRWEMYHNQHLLISPRSYGGLSLPVQEALRCGLVPMMPDCPPNNTWPGPRIPVRKGRLHPSPGGPVPTFLVDPRHIAHVIDDYERDRDKLAHEMSVSVQWASENTWSRLRPLYDRILN